MHGIGQLAIEACRQACNWTLGLHFRSKSQESNLLSRGNNTLSGLRISTCFRVLVPLALATWFEPVTSDLPPTAFDAGIAGRYSPGTTRTTRLSVDHIVRAKGRRRGLECVVHWSCLVVVRLKHGLVVVALQAFLCTLSCQGSGHQSYVFTLNIERSIDGLKYS